MEKILLNSRMEVLASFLGKVKVLAITGETREDGNLLEHVKDQDREKWSKVFHRCFKDVATKLRQWLQVNLTAYRQTHIKNRVPHSPLIWHSSITL